MMLFTDTDTRQGVADLIVFGVVFLAPVVLFGGLTLWLTTSHAAMSSLRKRPRLLVDTFDGWRRWHAVVWALPVLGPLIYAVAWVSGRCRLSAEQFEAAREPFPDMPPIRGFVPPPPIPSGQGSLWDHTPPSSGGPGLPPNGGSGVR